MQIKEDVIHRGLQPRWITSSEICILFHIVQKPNSIILLLFIQNISKFLTSFPSCGHSSKLHSFGMISQGYKKMSSLEDTPQKVDNFHPTICLAYSCISSVKF